MQTVREMLTSIFDAESVESIQRECSGLEGDLLDVKASAARLAGANPNGFLQHSCGSSEILIAFYQDESRMKHPLFLVRDDQLGHQWDMHYRNKTRGAISPRPFPVLRLVQSA